MIKPNLPSLFLISFLVAAFAAVATQVNYAQEPDRVKHLKETIRQMELDTREMSDTELEFAIQKNAALLMNYSSDEFTPTVLFQLSELYIQKANRAFEIQMEEYEKEFKKFQNKVIKKEPQLPQVDFTEAISYLTELLNSYADVGFIDKVLYRLALCQQEEGNIDKSIQYFNQLISDVPHSNFVPEAYFRLGEHYFDKGKFDQAVPYYEHLVSAEMWSNQFFDMSLYKLGWSNYKLNKYPEAISAFMYLLKDIDVLERVQTQHLDRTASDLKREALAYISVSFSEYSTPEQAVNFLNSFSAIGYKEEILSQLGEIFLKQNRLDDAIQTFHYIVSEFPDHANAPEYIQKIILANEKKWDFQAANQARSLLIQQYNPNSNWYNFQKDSTVKADAVVLVKDAIYKKGIFHQKQARESKEDNGSVDSEYQEAIDQYKQFLNYFPRDSLAYKINYFLAECYYSLEQFMNAANEYKNVYSLYPGNGFHEDAAYNAILSYYKASELEQNSTQPDSLLLNEFYGLAGPVLIEARDVAEKNFIQTSYEFSQQFPDSPKTVDVLMKVAEVLNELDRSDLSRRIYMKIVNDYPNSKQFSKAVAMIAQLYFKEENFTEAKNWYDTVIKTLPDTLEVVKNANLMMASSHFKLAEKYKEEGQFQKAAHEFALISIQYPRSQVTELSLVESANMLLALRDTVKAAQVYEEFSNRYPDSRLAESSVLQAAKYRESIGLWEDAAEDYLKLWRTKSEKRAFAIFSAGKCYFEAQNWQKAIELLENYLAIVDDQNLKLEALCRVGLSWYELNDLNRARIAFSETVQCYQQTAGENNNYFVAQAQFMLGEIRYIRFINIELSPPFQENLNRKTEALKKVLEAYTAAVKFRVAEWSTAASFKIGKVFEEFARAVLQSPIPQSLTGEDKQTYIAELKKIALPFQKKALEAYQANIKQAEKNQIENTWVAQSRNQVTNLANVLQKVETNQNIP